MSFTKSEDPWNNNVSFETFMVLSSCAGWVVNFGPATLITHPQFKLDYTDIWINKEPTTCHPTVSTLNTSLGNGELVGQLAVQQYLETAQPAVLKLFVSVNNRQTWRFKMSCSWRRTVCHQLSSVSQLVFLFLARDSGCTFKLPLKLPSWPDDVIPNHNHE